jgi:hypothetical protein
MKTLGRILIILAVTALVTGALYLIVNAGGTGTASTFPQRGERFASARTFEAGARPEFEGGRPERGERGGGWVFGLIKNVGVIALLVAILVLPKELAKRKRLAAVKVKADDAM